MKCSRNGRDLKTSTRSSSKTKADLLPVMENYYYTSLLGNGGGWGGASAHSDYGMITLLATHDVPGLQVCMEKHKHPRTWENVNHVKG
ncbi:2-oxoglutarate (2OG) and Fe(II)-dependent oxygenase superfamily protein [Tanacetum coccineum]